MMPGEARHDTLADLRLAQAETQREPGGAPKRGGLADVRRTDRGGSLDLMLVADPVEDVLGGVNVPFVTGEAEC